MAANPATIQDLQGRALRTLSDVETSAASSFLLDDAYNHIIVRVPSVARRLDEGPTAEYESTLISTVCAMVLRVLNNPNGLLEEGVDDYTSRRDAVQSSGLLYATEAELALLAESGESANAFSIRPAGRTPDATWTPDRLMFW